MWTVRRVLGLLDANQGGSWESLPRRNRMREALQAPLREAGGKRLRHTEIVDAQIPSFAHRCLSASDHKSHPMTLVIRQGHAECAQEGNSGGRQSDNRPIGTCITIISRRLR